MDEFYTVCEDWGEGSGLQIWETDCSLSDPGQQCKLLHFAIFPLLTHHITDYVRVQSVKGNNTEESSFAGVNLTFLLIIICINFLIIGISLIIWRWRILSQYFLENNIFQKNEKEKKRDSLHSQHWGLPGEEWPGPVQMSTSVGPNYLNYSTIRIVRTK